MAKMKRKLKKILSLVLVLSLCMSMMGMTAFAQGDENPCEHDFVVNLEESTATCAQSGTEVSYCSKCGEKQVRTDVILDHEPTSVTVTKQATCTEKGEETCYCELCDVSYARSIPALGHEYGEDGVCIREGCGHTLSSVGSSFVVDDVWEKSNPSQPKFDTFTLTCTVRTTPDENGQGGTVAVTGWNGKEGNTTSTNVYILIPETVQDDNGNTYTVTEVTCNFQMNTSNQKKGKLMGFYLRAPVKELTVNSMFANQTNLQILQLPDTLEVIGVGCFSGCTRLGAQEKYPVVLPEGLKEIGIGAFKKVNFAKQPTLDIPASVTKIGTGAFENSGLKAVTGGEGVTSLEGTVFQNCYSLTSVEFPNVTEVASATFFSAPLGTVGWDWSQMTEIGESAFDGCYGLKVPVTLSGDCQLGITAFCNSGITSLTIGEGMTEIPKWAFYYCFNLSEITLPNSLETIGEGAFAGCGCDLPDGEKVTITIGSDKGSMLTTVGSDAFASDTIPYDITLEASEDDVNGFANLTNSGKNTVTCTVPSLELSETVGETGKTLQELIDDAAATEDTADDTIQIPNNLRIDTTITIPEGAVITLTGDGTTLKARNLDGTMFQVDGSLTLEGSLNIRCDKANSVFTVNGELTMNGGVVSGFTAAKGSTGAVDVYGTFTMNDGSITGSNFTGYQCAAVRVEDGGQFLMNGGSISDNVTSGQYSAGGVLVLEGGTFTMENGEISRNKGHRGAGVLLYGGVVNDGENIARFTMNGGSISGNETTGYLTLNDGTSLNPGGGGVYVLNDAEFTLNGGSIANNINKQGMGGGVATEAYYPEKRGGVFVMNGGTITGNLAQCGGGVYSYSNDVYLLAGAIAQNEATSLGGGAYVSIQGRSIHLGDGTVIMGNDATVMGGGVWSCPTGTVVLAEDQAAVFDNTAQGAGDDVAALYKTTGIETTVNTYVLGGGVATWYQDGATFTNVLNNSELGSVDENAPRYMEGDASVQAPQSSTNSFTGKAVLTDDAKAAAIASAKLLITANTAARGGGIGSNGSVLQESGDLEVASLEVDKVWAENSIPLDSVTVYLVMSRGEELSLVAQTELSEENDWHDTFLYIPQEGVTYTVIEEDLSGWTAEVVATDTGYTVINTPYSGVDPDDPPDVNDPDDPGEEDIGDIDTPTTGGTDDTNQNGEDVKDDDTPMAGVPGTGDTTLVWPVLSLLCVAGLIGTAFFGRKRREE